MIIKNIDKFAIIKVIKKLNNINPNYKHSYITGNGDLNKTQNLRLINIKKYKKYIN